MARSCFVWRICLCWCLLLCVLPTVEAGTVNVKVPSLTSQVSKGSAVLSDSKLTFSTAIEGEFIPAPTKNVPVRGILGGTEFGLRTIIPNAKSLLRGGLAGVAAGYAFDKLIDGLGWAMDPKTNTPVKKVPAGPIKYVPSGTNYAWVVEGAAYSSAGAACSAIYDKYSPGYPDPGMSLSVAGNGAFCRVTSSDWHSTSANIERFGSTCPNGSGYNSVTGSCDATTGGGTKALTDADWISVDDFIKAQNSDFVKNLLQQSCLGSNNPEGCYQSLRTQQLALRGPPTVDAGTTTTTTTSPASDGTVNTTVTATTTSYNMAYQPASFTFNKHTSTTTTINGKPSGTTETVEQPSDEVSPDDPASEDPSQNPTDPTKDPETETPTTPSPCAGTTCDGPAYTKLYEPTKDTKEKYLDSYISRVKALPLFASVGNFFKVTASAGCPVWSSTADFNVLGASSSYNLVFDFHCQGWFVSVASYASAVMSIVCAFLAFRQAFLD